MKEFLNRFSFGDFVAYFLPGLAMVGAIAGVLYYTPFRDHLAHVTSGTTLVDVLIIACAAYVTGAVVSGMGSRFLPVFFSVTRLRRFVDPRDAIEPQDFTESIRTAFDRVFRFATGRSWNPSYFYLLRSAVHHLLPHAAVECSRQNSLMQLRENLLLPVLTWGFAGVLFAIDEFSHQPEFAGAVAYTCIVGVYFVAGRIAWRAVENRRREVREACLGFLVAERLGLLQTRSTASMTAAMTTEVAALSADAKLLSSGMQTGGSA